MSDPEPRRDGGSFLPVPVPIECPGRFRASQMTICRRFAASLLLAVLPLALAAQQQERLSLLGFTFRHQPSGEALALVQPMLSSRGTVELQAGNKMVVHDARVILARILPMLREFDHPVRALDLEVMVVKASRAVMSPPVSHSDL